jgi:hypothetical protein
MLLKAEVADFAHEAVDWPLGAETEYSVLETIRFAPLKLDSEEADFVAKEVALFTNEPAGVPLCVEAEPRKMLEPGTSAEDNDCWALVIDAAFKEPLKPTCRDAAFGSCGCKDAAVRTDDAD